MTELDTGILGLVNTFKVSFLYDYMFPIFRDDSAGR